MKRVLILLPLFAMSQLGAQQRVSKVPVIRGGGSQPVIESVSSEIRRASAPLTAAEKNAIATAAFAASASGPTSPMSQIGLQADETAVIHLDAAKLNIPDRAHMTFGEGEIQSFGFPFIRFTVDPAAFDLAAHHAKPYFWPQFRATSGKAYFVDCEVWVTGNVVFATQGQNITLASGHHHYSVVVAGTEKPWVAFQVAMRPGKLDPGVPRPYVQLHSCEITPLK